MRGKGTEERGISPGGKRGRDRAGGRERRESVAYLNLLLELARGPDGLLDEEFEARRGGFLPEHQLLGRRIVA